MRFADNKKVSFDLVKDGTFPLNTIFCRIDWKDGFHPLAVSL